MAESKARFLSELLNADGTIKSEKTLDSDVRTSFSAATSGDGSLTYSSATGVFTYAGPNFDSDFSLKTTADLTEGSNLYYTTVRADSDFDVRLTTKTTDDLTEGSNLYYTTVRADSDIADYLTGNISTGNITTTGYIRGPSTFTIDPATHGDDTGTLVIAGNLQVDGTTTTINSTTVEVDDKNIVLASGAGIGTTSPDTLMELRAANPILTIRDTETSTASNDARIRLAETGVSDALGNYFDIGYIQDALRFRYNNTEHMRITSGGALIITGKDTDSGGSKAYVNGIGGAPKVESALDNVSLELHSGADASPVTIYFKSGVNSPSDFAYISYFPNYAGVSEEGVLVIGSENDGTGSSDYIRLQSRVVVDNTMVTTTNINIMEWNAGSTNVGYIDTNGDFLVTGDISGGVLTTTGITRGGSGASFTMDLGSAFLNLISGNSVIFKNQSNNPWFTASDTQVELYSGAQVKFRTTSTGAQVSVGDLQITDGIIEQRDSTNAGIVYPRENEDGVPLETGLAYFAYNHAETIHPLSEIEFDTVERDDITSFRTSGTWDNSAQLSLSADSYLTEVHGYLLITTAGDYRFGVEADDSVDMYIDGVRVADDYGAHGATAFFNDSSRTSIYLTVGYHKLFARFLEISGGDSIRLGWNGGSGTTISAIPAANLYHDAEDRFKSYNGTINGVGNLTMTGTVTGSSDERLKTNIETLDGSKVLQMRGVSFLKDGEKGSGVIAQELEKIAPELVHDSGFKSVAYGNLVGYLIEAVKMQQKQIDSLRSEIENIKNNPE